MSALDPNRRLAFTDALRPPPGYVLEAGLGTAFSLDFDAFTAVVLAFVGADLEEGPGDPATVLTTIARLRDRLRVFVQGGRLRPPDRTNRVLALYDRVLRSVVVPDAAFHPKVWVLKFAPRANPEMRRAQVLYRVLCSSRNVTDSRCWELGVRLEGRLGTPSPFGSDVGAFCRRVAKEGGSTPKSVWKLISELPRVTFEAGPDCADGLVLHWQWPGHGSLAHVLPGRARRALCVSPFVRSDFLETLAERVDNLVVISTQQELDALPEATYEQLAKADVYVVTGVGTGEVPSLDLHAKLIAWERDGIREMLVGSANATGAAWGTSARTNCEAMVALRPGHSIEGMLRDFVSPERGRLHGWIDRYRREKVTVTELDRAERMLDRVQQELGRVIFVGRYERDPARLTVVARGEPPPAFAEAGTSVVAEMAPLLRVEDAHAWQPVCEAFGGGAQFHSLHLQDLCAFAVVRLRDREQRCQPKTFGIQFLLPLGSGEQEARDAAVHARLLEGIDARALLLNVLRGLPSGSGASALQGHAESKQATPLLAHATIERVMEVCTEDRSRIAEVDALLAACRSAPGMSSFQEFWDSFKRVLEEENRA